MEKHAFALILFLAIGLVTRSTAQITNLGVIPVNLLFSETLGVTQIDCYIQNTIYGQGEDSYEIADSSITTQSLSRFGYLAMIDDVVTEGPDPTSNVIGRAQGLFGSADVNTPGFFLDFNIYFTSGSYNGSTLHISGRDSPSMCNRELSVTGGTQEFRLAMGFVTVSTISGNSSSATDTFQFNIRVFQPILS
ncbi:hypothetical protein MLD38_013495 [Melastoma candidum]|uniref:Uncharacterized protein n=2 Tax=Melastoma candidum TaxID=119954 RepID=A0ACB9RBK8_9MYRT|nr:hypothetical protein MLD38_013489 [Melastoma candidum]KAI4375647.1 hypothetical protein MLD38_013495 [Melastoma candidum]